MNEAKSTGRDQEVEDCFDDRKSSESCDEAFLRCAWGL
jgi:hypothetical protein